ncbi:hypothetical protein [Ramlibacter albus]|uniref:Uncharacterized protein n=1 Tax=Ramlibacter albus TaxID=2079448 RepID=A0A923S3W5_9BURK|nr:hypothetical protein [Ramlibacter albus]MBC5766851.1 hypothetical protein [Ramlibacter albus]
MATSDVTRSRNLVALATQLERWERGWDTVEPGQFRDVIEQLKAELAATPSGALLETVLASFPSTAELYENLNYEHAGLCRSNLDAALKSEIEARNAIASARRSRTA